MTRKNSPNTNKSKKQRTSRDPIPWRYCFVTLGCGLILVVGFFFAARQHFSSIDFSMKNSTLRKQIEELEAGKRRLILAKEVALSPGEIKKAAQKIGFREMTASNIEVFRPNNPAEKPKPEKASEEKTKPSNSVKAAEPKKPEKEAKVEKKTKAEKENTDNAKSQIARK